MKAKDQWFAIFGTDGAPFIKGIINGVLGVMLVLLLVLAVIKTFADLAQLKLTEDEDRQRQIKASMKKTISAFMLGALGTSLMILIINIIPKSSQKITNSSWFDTFGGQKGEVQSIVNWIFASLSAIGIILFILTTPWKIIKWMWADEDKKREAWKGIPRNIICIIVLLSLTLFTLIIINLIPNPAHI